VSAEKPAGIPDRRNWRQLRSLLEGGPGGPKSGDYLALRWHDGWRLVERWRPEREGILCVLEQGGSIWVDKAGGLMATGEVPCP
jgi:hypothetical protein